MKKGLISSPNQKKKALQNEINTKQSLDSWHYLGKMKCMQYVH